MSEAARERFREALTTLLPESIRVIALFRALPGELAVEPLEVCLRARFSGVSFAYPRIEGDTLCFHAAAADAPKDFAPGAYGILEPREGLPEVEPAAIDAVLVPGVVYSPEGLRGGRGAGFYDRFIPRLRANAIKVSLAFDFQVRDAVAFNPWDQAVDAVVTETRVLRKNVP